VLFATLYLDSDLVFWGFSYNPIFEVARVVEVGDDGAASVVGGRPFPTTQGTTAPRLSPWKPSELVRRHYVVPISNLRCVRRKRFRGNGMQGGRDIHTNCMLGSCLFCERVHFPI
jgi:hypothetical protein